VQSSNTSYAIIKTSLQEQTKKFTCTTLDSSYKHAHSRRRKSAVPPLPQQHRPTGQHSAPTHAAAATWLLQQRQAHTSQHNCELKNPTDSAHMTDARLSVLLTRFSTSTSTRIYSSPLPTAHAHAHRHTHTKSPPSPYGNTAHPLSPMYFL